MTELSAVCDTIKTDAIHRKISATLEEILLDSAIKSDTERALMKNELRRLPGNPPAFKSRFDSQCLICGGIYYGEMRLLCARCHGRCRIMPPDEMQLSERKSFNSLQLNVRNKTR